MKPWFLALLFLDFAAVSLLLAAFAYNWLGNVAHEIIGTAMVLLLISHNVFNRRWYGNLASGSREVRALVTKAINLSLLVSMLALLTTSVIISQTVFSFLPVTSSFGVRQFHTLAAYLALLVASAHLGLHWSMIMAVARSRFGITATSRSRGIILRTIALVIAAGGIQSFMTLNVAAKLSMQVGEGFGGFQMTPPAVILNHLAIVGLGAAVTHYARILSRKAKQRSATVR